MVATPDSIWTVRCREGEDTVVISSYHGSVVLAPDATPQFFGTDDALQGLAEYLHILSSQPFLIEINEATNTLDVVAVLPGQPVFRHQLGRLLKVDDELRDAVRCSNVRICRWRKPV